MGHSIKDQVNIVVLDSSAVEDLLMIENESSPSPWSENLFRREFENRFSSLHGIELSGKVIAFAVVHRVLDEAHIVNFAVKKQLRRRGYGAMLLNELLKQFTSDGVRWVFLEVRSSNLPAIGLYESFDFYRVGERKGYYSDNGENGILMNLDLNNLSPSQSAAVS